MPSNIENLDKLCIHTITTKPWTLKECCENYAAAGIKGISVWRDTLEGRPLSESKKMLDDNGMEVVSLVRGGFFTSQDNTQREAALDVNREAIAEAAAIGAPLVVLVCGATPGQSVKTNVAQIQAGIEALIPDCEAHGVKLGIEPLHPMYADTRSAIVTMAGANDVAEAIDSKWLGVTVDVFHLWWDLHLEQEIKRCGKNGNLFSFHICDWKENMADMLNDRGLMGDGVIDVPTIRGWVEEAGFSGYNEVEIFSNSYWEMDQNTFLEKICNAYKSKS